MAPEQPADSSHSPSLATCRKVVALIGNPNCGKTTLFNALTGSNYKVANYPGVTVERREGALALPDGCARLFDLPGTYSLEGATLDEQVVTRFLDGSIPGCPQPDLLVVVVDATNLERNLFLLSELIDSGYPVVLAINMTDAAERAGLTVYTELLARQLDLPAAAISARAKTGLTNLTTTIAAALKKPPVSNRRLAWLPSEHLLRPDTPGGTRPSGAATLHEAAALRFTWIRSIVERCTSRNRHSTSRWVERLDQILTSKVWGIPIMVAVFALMFQAIFLWAELPMELIGSTVEQISNATKNLLPPGPLTNLLTEGIIPGVGNVVVFVPQIALLFLCIGILEDCGYLSRAAFLLDNFMRRVGLQGRAFIPLLSSFACAVPGILATRTIPARSDRLATIMIAPLMSCSARLPVYAVLIGAAIPNVRVAGFCSLRGVVLLALYLLGVVTACGVAWILKKFLLWRDHSFYIVEMPPLRAPLARVVLRGVFDSVVSFLRNATTVILACSVIIWFLSAYPEVPAGYQENPVRASYAGQIGVALEPFIAPLGFNWEIGIAILASFPAREVFISGLSTVYAISARDDQSQGLLTHLEQKQLDGSFTTATALSLLVFYVFACQCMSTLAVCRRETGSWGWTAGMFGYMTALAYLGAFVTYQLARGMGL